MDSMWGVKHVKFSIFFVKNSENEVLFLKADRKHNYFNARLVNPALVKMNKKGSLNCSSPQTSRSLKFLSLASVSERLLKSGLIF